MTGECTLHPAQAQAQAQVQAGNKGPSHRTCGELGSARCDVLIATRTGDEGVEWAIRGDRRSSESEARLFSWIAPPLQHTATSCTLGMTVNTYHGNLLLRRATKVYEKKCGGLQTSRTNGGGLGAVGIENGCVTLHNFQRALREARCRHEVMVAHGPLLHHTAGVAVESVCVKHTLARRWRGSPLLARVDERRCPSATPSLPFPTLSG